MYNRLSSYISHGVYTVSGPFHPFGGAVDIVVVEQQDGTFKSTPWYVKFGKFQGVLKRREKIVAIGVNDVEAKFHMHLDHKGEAYFLEDPGGDEKQPFSPPSGPSSGDEGQETLAIEYHKTEETENQLENDSSGEDEPEQEESAELQFLAEDACSDGFVSREPSQEGSKISELLNEAVGVKDEKVSTTPGAALLANSALASLQKVAELPKQEADGTALEVTAETSVEEASSVYVSEENVKHAGSKNGEYAYEVTRMVDNRVVIKESGGQDVQVEIGEMEKEVSSSTEKQEEANEVLGVSECDISNQEKAWTEVITKAAAALQEEPAQKVSETNNVERRTWGWWVWRSGSTNKPRLESQASKSSSTSEKKAEKERTENLKTEGSLGSVMSAEEQCTETTETAPNKAQKSRSVLGMMFGAGKAQVQSDVQRVQEVTAENVVELLDSKWTVGSGGKSENGEKELSPKAVFAEQEESSVPFEDASDCPEPRKERSITSNVDLSTAEVVLMSVDGHVVVAKQDDSSPRQGYKPLSPRGDRFQAAARTAPISVPGKRIVELTDDTELKVGSESTLDTSPHRTDIGRLSNSLSSYFVGKEGNSSAAVDEPFSSNAASEIPSAGTDADEAVDKASMDVQVGSPWSTVSIPAGTTVEESDTLKADEPQKPEAAEEVDMSKTAGFELSLCRNLLREGMGVEAAGKVFDEHKLTLSSFKKTACLMGNEELVVRVGGKYYPSGVAASILFSLLAFGQLIPPKDGEPIKVEAPESKDLIVRPGTDVRPSSGGWRLWPFGARRAKSSDSNNGISNEALFVATEAALHNSLAAGLLRNGYYMRSWRDRRTLLPTSEQLASLNLKPGKNKITFTFTTRVLGKQQVDARIYLWKWNTKIVVSDVDGTITKSDVLGQVMPLVGRDWTQTGVTRLFSAIKDNGYELMFLSARAISQAYLTRQFLLNLIQDGEPLPDGPVVISPDGLFPSLYREVIRRAPHEFKISCLEDIKALFPADCQPFYAGFGNRDTDEISYLKVGIPKGKIFIINPKGEVIVNNILDMKSYTSLHKLVNDMFPPVNLTEREDFNSWNYWKMPLPDVDDF